MRCYMARQQQYTNHDVEDPNQVRQQQERDAHIDGQTWTMIGIIVFIPTLYLIQIVVALTFG
jgi:hypothetical protein